MAEPLLPDRPRTHPPVRDASAAKGVDEAPGAAGQAAFTRVESPALWAPAVNNYEKQRARLRIGAVATSNLFTSTAIGIYFWPHDEPEIAEAKITGSYVYVDDPGGRTAQSFLVYERDSNGLAAASNRYSNLALWAGRYGQTLNDTNGPSLEGQFIHENGSSVSYTNSWALRQKLDGSSSYIALEGVQTGGYLGEVTTTSATTGVNDAANETDLTGMSLTVTTLTGRKYRFQCKTHIQSDTASTNCIIRLKEDGTTISEARHTFAYTGSLGLTTLQLFTTRAPSAGSHTYKLTLETDQGTGTLQTNLSSTRNGHILIEDIGAA